MTGSGLGSCKYFCISPIGARPSGNIDILATTKHFRLTMKPKQFFPAAPLPLSRQTPPEGMQDAFQDVEPQPPLPPSPVLLWLCVCWLLSSSQMAVIIQTWDLASRLLWNTLEGWRGSGPRRGLLLCVVQKPPHYCLFSLYMKISHCIRNCLVGFLLQSLHLFLEYN